MFLTSLRQCFRSTLFDPNTAFVRPVLLYLPVHHALSSSSVSHPLLVPFPFLSGMIQNIIFRAIPSISFFVILPLLLYILLVYPCLPDAAPHLSAVVGPNYHPPVLSIALLPHATFFSIRSFTVFSFSLSHCQLQGYHIMSASLPVRLSSLSVRMSASSICFSVTKAGYLPTLSLCIYLLK